jgi:hypothetical protein
LGRRLADLTEQQQEVQQNFVTFAAPLPGDYFSSIIDYWFDCKQSLINDTKQIIVLGN